MRILGFTLYVCTSRGSLKGTLALTEVMTLLTVSQATLLKLQKKIGDKISEKTFQKTSQDPKPTCHHLILIHYFNSEQLKVFKENQYSLNTYLHAEWGKEIYEPEKISPFNIRSASVNCRTEWYADCIQVCIYLFSYLQQEPTFATASVSGECQSWLFVYLYSACIEAAARERTIFLICCKHSCDVSIGLSKKKGKTPVFWLQ